MTDSMENTLDLDGLLVIAKRRAWLMVTVCLVGLVVSVIVIQHLPPRYRSTAIVSVESQQVPEGFVQSTVSGYANERIGFVKQRVMTTGRLLEVVDKHQLYPEKRGKVPAPLLAAEFRENVFLETIVDPAIGKGRSSTVAFTLGFEHGDPEIATAVATDLVTMFLDENVRTRTARATETTEFLAQEASRLNEQVSAMDARVAEFKQKHSDTLPEHLGLRMGMLQRSEADLKALEREILALAEEKRFLETQRMTLGAILSAGASPDARVMSPAQLLAALKAELLDKTAVYGSAHPDLRRLRRRIALLEREVESAPSDEENEPSATVPDPAKAQIETQISSAEARLVSLREQKRALQGKIEKLQARIMQTPQIERAFKALTRDYENARAEYEEIRGKQRDAKLAENLEKQEKAERFVLLESPQVPSAPVWPEKPKVYVLGFVLAVGSGAGTAFLAEFLDKTIRGPAVLTSILQRHPLAVIPFIERSGDRSRQRVRRLSFLLAAFLVLITVLAVTHVLYQPLDVLLISMREAVVLP